MADRDFVKLISKPTAIIVVWLAGFIIGVYKNVDRTVWQMLLLYAIDFLGILYGSIKLIDTREVEKCVRALRRTLKS